MRIRTAGLTPEHLFPLLVVENHAGLQLLAFQESGDSESFRLRRTRLDRLRLSLGTLLLLLLLLWRALLASLLLLLLLLLLNPLLHLAHLLYLFRRRLLAALLLRRLHLRLLLGQRSCAHLVDVFRNGHAVSLGLCCDLCLHGADLLGGGLLHARRGTALGHWAGTHCGTRVFASCGRVFAGATECLDWRPEPRVGVLRQEGEMLVA